MEKLIAWSLSITVLAGTLVGCKTQDVLPKVTWETDGIEVGEDGGELILKAKLNGPTSQQIIVQIEISGTATIGSDYDLSAQTITIPKGEDEGSLVITGLQDDLIEGTETIIITMTNPEGYEIGAGADSITLSILDGDIDSDNDGVPDSEDDCPFEFGLVENNGCPLLGFIINEVLYDPADDLPGDANNDGTRDPLDDEFIEFYNGTNADLDLSGYKIFDATNLSSNIPRHVFPAGTIVPANKAIVVFGGGSPTGDFGSSIVQTASGGQLNLTNNGDLITIQDAQGTTVLTFDISVLSTGPNESYTRALGFTDQFYLHSSIPQALGALHSPGKQLDGTNF